MNTANHPVEKGEMWEGVYCTSKLSQGCWNASSTVAHGFGTGKQKTRSSLFSLVENRLIMVDPSNSTSLVFRDVGKQKMGSFLFSLIENKLIMVDPLTQITSLLFRDVGTTTTLQFDSSNWVNPPEHSSAWKVSGWRLNGLRSHPLMNMQCHLAHSPRHYPTLFVYIGNYSCVVAHQHHQTPM